MNDPENNEVIRDRFLHQSWESEIVHMQKSINKAIGGKNRGEHESHPCSEANLQKSHFPEENTRHRIVDGCGL